jgi:hypothetical protein
MGLGHRFNVTRFSFCLQRNNRAASCARLQNDSAELNALRGTKQGLRQITEFASIDPHEAEGGSLGGQE